MDIQGQSRHAGYLTSFATKWQLQKSAAVDLYKQDCLGWRLSRLAFLQEKKIKQMFGRHSFAYSTDQRGCAAKSFTISIPWWTHI